MSVSIDEFNSILHYNPKTGIFTARKSFGKIKKGQAVGRKHNMGYLCFSYKGTVYLMHRLALYITTGIWPYHTDHINHIKTDNRFCNLRAVSPKENLRNKVLYGKNKSGVHGVHYDKHGKRWRAQIPPNGTKGPKKLGSYKTMEEAIKARRQAEIGEEFHRNHGCE